MKSNRMIPKAIRLIIPLRKDKPTFRKRNIEIKRIPANR